MIFEKPLLSTLLNESDVEQKFIYPLLHGDSPNGFGIPAENILTKHSIKRMAIGKRQATKLYYPDYLIVVAGLPLVVVEAKPVGDDLTEAFREARLYAAELNALFRSGANPVKRIVATDGARFLFGNFDDAEPCIDLTYEDVEPYNQKFGEAHNFLKFNTILDDFHNVSANLRPARYFKPRRLLGGDSVQNDDVGHNSFGATLSAELAHIFNPVSREDRAKIASEGYVPSRRRERYVDPIDRVIRAASPSFIANATLIEDTENPVEILAKIRPDRTLENQILLIIGNVGSGKTTFVDRLQAVSLSKEVREHTLWVHINMNNAPISPIEIYDFLRNEITFGLQRLYSDIDFDDLETLKSLYSVEVNKFNKGTGKLYKKDSDAYNEKLAVVIDRSNDDLHIRAVSHCRYLGTERKKLVVIVLDNCDKRNLPEQLLMFEAAQWLQHEFRALTILPLREETYDNHRDQKPLDTALKDLVFRIEPPLFHQVLVSRVQLALNELAKTGPKKLSYDLPNGFRVEYPASDQAYYLTSIISSVFEHDRQIRRMIVGLAGRNIRRAFEIFIEFCNSGHITEDYILRIRRTEGKFVLPLALVLNVLLRNNRRYYDGDVAAVRNLFDLDIKDHNPSYFTRLIILRWLLSKASIAGPNGSKGYFPVSYLTSDLDKYGLERRVVEREIEYLAQAQCVITEDFSTSSLKDSTLVRLGPAGFVHLELIENASYWGAVAEDTWFNENDIARRIAVRLGDKLQHYSPQTVLKNGRDVLEYLEHRRSIELSRSNAIFEKSKYQELTDLSGAFDGLTKLLRTMTSGPWVDVLEKYKSGQEYEAIVVNHVPFGVFAELEPGLEGLIHISRLPKDFESIDQLAPGEKVIVKVIEVDPVAKRIPLALT